MAAADIFEGTAGANPKPNAGSGAAPVTIIKPITTMARSLTTATSTIHRLALGRIISCKRRTTLRMMI